MSDTITIEAKSIMWGATDKAKMFEVGNKGQKVWVPRSVFEFYPHQEHGDPVAGNGNVKGKLHIKKWFYEQFIKNKL